MPPGRPVAREAWPRRCRCPARQHGELRAVQPVAIFKVVYAAPESQLFAMTHHFHKTDFQAKLGAVARDKGLLHINPAQYNTYKEADALYHQMKDKAHKWLNEGCQAHLGGHDEDAKKLFAHCWQGRSFCDFLFKYLRNATMDAAHQHMMEVLETALRALCMDDTVLISIL
jgi:hypothetical protein